MQNPNQSHSSIPTYSARMVHKDMSLQIRTYNIYEFMVKLVLPKDY